jgi:hypothetical protein
VKVPLKVWSYIVSSIQRCPNEVLGRVSPVATMQGHVIMRQANWKGKSEAEEKGRAVGCLL